MWTGKDVPLTCVGTTHRDYWWRAVQKPHCLRLRPCTLPSWCREDEGHLSCLQRSLPFVFYRIPFNLIFSESLSINHFRYLLYFQNPCPSTGFSINSNLIQSASIFKTNKQTKQPINPNPISTLKLKHTFPFKIKLSEKNHTSQCLQSSSPFLS